MCRPTPTIGFRRRSGSMSLPLGRHEIRREGTELFITNVRPSDEGDYACLGSNSVGQTEEIIQIDVQGIHSGFNPGSILSVESNQNVESKMKNVDSKTDKCGVQNSIWSVDSQENH